MLLTELKGKKILILGFGREGQDTFLFLRKKLLRKNFKDVQIGIADQNENALQTTPKNTAIHLGKSYLKAIPNYDVVIKSPGIPNSEVLKYLAKNQTLTSQTDMFLENCEGTVIGITGTKGKSTTSSLIYEVLTKGGVKAHLLGNIGKPVLSDLAKQSPEDVFVYELSSFQLENLRESPHIAVLLNIYPEHLNHHGSFDAYVKAKTNITKYQKETDFLIYNSKDPLVSRIAKTSKAQKLPFIYKKSSHSWIASSEPARIIGKLFYIKETTIEKAIQNFKPLPDRLERVGKYKGITFYNDSLATIPEATISALDTLGLDVQTLIAGGFDRGIKFEKLGKRIQQSKVKALILFPTTGKKILQAIKKPPQHFFAKTMEEAVRLCYAHTQKGKISLLSPAASSFNMFKDYKDRGDQFKKFVKLHGKTKKA